MAITLAKPDGPDRATAPGGRGSPLTSKRSFWKPFDIFLLKEVKEKKLNARS